MMASPGESAGQTVMGMTACTFRAIPVHYKTLNIKTMKKLLFVLLSVFMITSAFYVPSCQKEMPVDTLSVNITFDDDTETVTFTGEQGQGTYVFNSLNTTQSLPDTGTYGICISWGGGCGGYRLSDDNTNLLLVMPTGGTTCGTGFILVGQYYAWTNCE